MLCALPHLIEAGALKNPTPLVLNNHPSRYSFVRLSINHDK